MIGQPVKRKEDLRFITGRGSYVDDVRVPGLKFASLVRSVHAHADVLGVDKGPALAIPGVLGVFLADDLAELSRPIPGFTEARTNPYCDFNVSPPQFPLVRGRARYAGEPVAVVVAENAYLAVDGAAVVQVEYRALPAVTDPEEAMRPESPRIHDGAGNVVGHIAKQIGNMEEALAGADVILKERFTYPRLSSFPIEPRGIVAAWDAATETLTIWAAHQLPYLLRDTVAKLLDLPYARVRVVAGDIGGGFGPKGPIYPEDLIIPVLAYRLRTPVKWIEDRSEHFLCVSHARDQRHDVTLAATRDGVILGIDIRMVKDVGAYHHWEMIEPSNTVNHLPGPYRVPSIRAEGTSVVTNKMPACPYRGAGRPEAGFVMERLLDHLARRVALDPVEVRLRNLVGPEEMPYKSGLTYRDGVAITYDGGDYPMMLRRALEIAEYEGWRRRQTEARREGRAIGIGIASHMEAGGIGWPCEGATVRVDDTGRVTVSIGVSCQGQSHETVFAQVCASVLGARYEEIEVRGGDTSLISYGFGTGASRVAVNTGNAVALAAEAVRARACRVAARLLECDERDVRVEESRVFVAGAPMRSLSLGEVARAAVRSPALMDFGSPGLTDTKFYYPPSVTWASGVSVAVVEVDRETGRCRVLTYACVHDCGKPLNPAVVESQVLGGLVQGFGAALGEEIRYDANGQLVNGSLLEYYIPRADDLPPIVLDHVVFHTDHNPLGVRGVGEGATVPPGPAIANAIADALEGRVSLRSLPLTPAAVYRAMTDGRIA